MNLSDQQIQDFIEAWKGDFDETLLPEVARSEAARLLDFFVWMTEEFNAQKALKNQGSAVPKPPSAEDNELKEAWRKTMMRRR